MAQRFWPRVPVILESEHYGHSKSRGVWGDGAKYLQVVEDYHASYVSIHWWPREFLAENRDLVNRINLRLGYRLQLIEASWPERAAPGDHIHVEAVWRNAGVAPCYPGGHPALTLKDEAGGVVAVFTDEGFDLRSLPVGPPGEADKITQTCVFRVPQTLKPGRYEVFISADSSTRVPTLALPLAHDDGQRRYRLGLVEVVSRQ
jgi:hypothetical protein